MPPACSEAAPLAVWAVEHLYKRDGVALNEQLVSILDGSSSITVWRESFTLCEFESAQSMDVWFDYPLHVPDHRRALAQCPYDGGEVRSTGGSGRSRAQAREEKQRCFEEAFGAVSMGEDTVRIDDLAEYLGVSPKTVKRRIDESRHLERNDGYVRRRT